ncbi:hypothetical protein ACTJJB_22615 [Chitinophaga sp. 22536]|uniref:hypothetical protein n=1 Tax=unclassified Chitinophaga TaxID=2619133 RepID=UPI003F8519C2
MDNEQAKSIPLAHIQPVPFEETITEGSSLTVEDATVINHRGIINYLHRNGIHYKVARQHARQVRVFNSKKGRSFLAVGMRNEDNGWEILNPYYCGTVGKRNILFIRGTDTKPDSIHFFKDAMDFLSAVMQNKNGCPLRGDAFICTFPSYLELVPAYIKEYDYKAAFTWMDNTEAGRLATLALRDLFKAEEGLEHLPMNFLYASHQDVNTWHRATLGLTAALEGK